MIKLHSALPTVLALLLASTLSVQAQTTDETATDDTAATQTETTETTEGTTPAAEEAAEPAANDLSLGVDANAEPLPGQPYTAEINGAWELRCVKSEAESDPCQMYQLLLDQQGEPVAEISIFRLPDGGKAEAGATIIVPLETALQQQLTVTVDGGSARRYPFAFCNAVGCYVRMGLTPADVASFKRGKEAKLSIVPVVAPDQRVNLTLSLSGFTASYDKASVLEQ